MVYDVIVIGAGPGGSAAARVLARAGLNVLLLDKATFPRDKTCGDGLTPRAVRMLAQLGALDAIMPRACRMTEATVHAPNGTPITTRMPTRSDRPPYMLAVPRLVLDDTLCRLAVASGAELHEGVHVLNLAEAGRLVTVEGRQGSKPYRATGRYAILAVGANLRLLLNLGVLAAMPPLILAARTYYENMSGLTGRFEFFFEGVPLPGYAWIFPLSANSGNVGAGVMETGRRRGRRPAAQEILRRFVESPAMHPLLNGARQAGPVKGFPLRTDFATAPTSVCGRTLIVGEAAGLVNPVTGEGVDYALESGTIAATHLLRAAAGDLAGSTLTAGYDAELRHEFQRLFVFSERIRDWYLRGPVLNHLVRVANKRDSLRALFTDVVLGNADASRATSPRTLAQILLTW